MIIQVGAQKGGCGKTTVSINLAAELVRLGKDVCLVDADRQGTANSWAQIRSDMDLDEIHSVVQYDKIHKTLKDLDKRYDFLIVDVAGRDSMELRSGLLAADILLTPFKPSWADLETMPHLTEVIEQAKTYNEDLTCKAVVVMAPTNPIVKELEEARSFMRDFPLFEVCSSVIRDRKAYRDCMAEGHSVIEWNNNKAKAEIQLLAQELTWGM